MTSSTANDDNTSTTQQHNKSSRPKTDTSSETSESDVEHSKNPTASSTTSSPAKENNALAVPQRDTSDQQKAATSDDSSKSDIEDHKNSCKVCRKVRKPWCEGDIARISYKEFASTVSAFKRAVFEHGCRFCSTVWAAFERLPPEEGWPPQNKRITIRVRLPAWKCVSLSIVSDKKTRKSNWKNYTFESQSAADMEYTVEIYHALPPSHEYVKYPAALFWMNEKTIRSVSPNSGSEEAFELVRLWFYGCRFTHEACHSAMAASASPLPKRLIEIPDYTTSRVYIRDGADLSGEYATLSYCWGAGPRGLYTTKENLPEHQLRGIPVEDLPQTVQNAVQIARALGIQYLWVDRFCIIQDDDDDWAREARNMCKIYGDSVLTISADSSKGVREGIFQDQVYSKLDYQELAGTNILVQREQHHATIENDLASKCQPIYRRAWTLQEHLMSRRVLHYTSNELVWECNEKTQCECRRVSGRGFRILHSLIYMSDMDDLYEQWKHLVTEYTSRSLSFGSDKLPALSGLAAKFQEIVQRIAGHPDTYLAGLWRGDLAAQLAWTEPTPAARETWLRENEGYHPEWRVKENEDPFTALKQRPSAEVRPGQYSAPSWSWAAMNGPITYLKSRPRMPFQSRIEILPSGVKMALKNEFDPYGQLTGGHITLRGHVVRDLSVHKFSLGFSSRKGDGEDGDEPAKRERDATVPWRDMFTLRDEDWNSVEINPDDPEETIRATTCEKDIICLLLGTGDVTLKSGIMIKGSKTTENKSWLGKDVERRMKRLEIKRAKSEGADKNGKDVAQDSDVDEEIARPDDHDEDWSGRRLQDPITDDEMGRDDVRYSFYLVLAPAKGAQDSPSSYKRLACFHTNMSFMHRKVMRTMFEKSKWEQITIV